MKTNEILLLLQARGFRFNANLGQNFLAEDAILEEILQVAEIGPDDCVLEIGAGAGCLTNYLSQHAGKVLAVECDETLKPVLETVLQGRKNVHIAWGDALKLDLGALTKEVFEGKPFKVVSNLPYCITTPAIMALLRSDWPIERAVLMIQTEAAARVFAEPGNKNYGPMAVWTDYRTEAEMAIHVPAHCFVPQPHVDSSVICMVWRETPAAQVQDIKRFSRMVDAAFAMRRKTMANNLCASFSVDKPTAYQWLENVGLPQSVRGETLDVHQLAALANESLK